MWPQESQDLFMAFNPNSWCQCRCFQNRSNRTLLGVESELKQITGIRSTWENSLHQKGPGSIKVLFLEAGHVLQRKSLQKP